MGRRKTLLRPLLCTGARRRALISLAPVVVALVAIPAGGTDTVSPPQITLNVNGTKGSNGWYRSSVSVSWTVTDPTGISSTSGCVTTNLNDETAGTTLSCQASNPSGLTSSVSVTIKIDKTPPQVTGGTPTRGSDVNGWYNRPVSFVFSGSDSLSGIASCPATTYAGPDGANATVTGTCRDNAGNVGTGQASVRYDATPPAVTAPSPDRKPDANGWYNHPVAVHFGGTDSASGIDSCTTATYSGPDTNGTSVSGTCRDRAGNTGSGSFSLRYDATPPALSGASVTSGDGVDTLHWASTSPADVARIRRRPRGAKATAAKTVFDAAATTYSDKIANGVEYVYTVQTFDQAGNGSKVATLHAYPKVLLLRRASAVPRVDGQPVLRWTKNRHATYYHVQLFRNGKRILAAWPVQPQYVVPATWTWQGHRYSLTRGTYRWFVWRGIGRRALAHYSRVGRAAFTVVSAPAK